MSNLSRFRALRIANSNLIQLKLEELALEAVERFDKIDEEVWRKIDEETRDVESLVLSLYCDTAYVAIASDNCSIGRNYAGDLSTLMKLIRELGEISDAVLRSDDNASDFLPAVYYFPIPGREYISLQINNMVSLDILRVFRLVPGVSVQENQENGRVSRYINYDVSDKI